MEGWNYDVCDCTLSDTYTEGTEAFKQVNPSNPRQSKRIMQKANPANRLRFSEEVANVVAFLSNHDALYVSRQTIEIDGGQSNPYWNV